MTNTTTKATRKAPAERIADLKSRFSRIRQALMAVDALTADYLDEKASELESFAGEMALLTGRESGEHAN